MMNLKAKQMRKRLLATSLIGMLLVMTLSTLTSVATADGFDWTTRASTLALASANASETETLNTNTAKQKHDNGFVRALGAPFRAIGRLFGGKKNDQQAHRTTEKDAVKFETTKVTRIKDSSIQPLEASAAPASTPAVPVDVAASQFDMHLQKGREFLVSGNLDGAISELSSAASLKPKSSEANNLLGIAYEGKGLRERALQSFELAVHNEENNAEHLNNLGFLLFKNGDYERATKYLKKAAKISPSDARIWNNLALAQCQRGKLDDAYESFVRAVGEFGAHVNIAAQMQSHGSAKDAISHLEKAQAMRPNAVDVLNKLVALYDITGRVTDAEAARRSLVALKTFADANK
jgi:Flp pilus assembly protein TadD